MKKLWEAFQEGTLTVPAGLELPAQSHPVLVPCPVPAWRDPTPELNSQIKLGQLTLFLQVSLPLPSRLPSGFLSRVVTVFGFYGLSTVSLTNRSIPLAESLAQLETRRKTTCEWPGTHLPLISNHRPIQLLDLTNGYQSARLWTLRKIC